MLGIQINNITIKIISEPLLQTSRINCTVHTYFAVVECVK